MSAPGNNFLPTFIQNIPLAKQLNVKRLNDMIYFMRSIQPLRGVGTLVKRTPGGTTIDAIAQGGGPAGTPTHPYKGYDASAGAIPKVRVQPGSHNSVVPTIGGIPIDNPIPPLLTVLITDTVVYVQIHLNLDQSIASIEIHSGMTTPIGGDGITAYQALFFIFPVITMGVASCPTMDNVSGSQSYEFCGGDDLFVLV